MDIDTDLANRDFAINYLIEKYGEEKVCQILNFSYITPCVAIKDVGRVLNIPYAICDKISKKFVADKFEDCMAANQDIVSKYSEYSDLFDIASHISGRVRNVSIHAGGVGIVDTKITDYMAMKLGSKGEHVIQVDKHVVEDIGIVKFDLLGVSTLTVVQEIQEDTGLTDWDLNINNPKFANDSEMYKLLQRADTNGVFQVESQGMKDLLIRLQPEDLNDVSAVLALYRPDSMPMLDDYIYYKHHKDEIKYWHPDIEPVLKSTYGSMVYQEQIMDIVRILGGRTMGGADKFRKGIGKKDKELVKKEAETLRGEIVQNGYDKELANFIADIMKEKGGYSFNKSHSALYALLTLKTAYLKAHYTAYFFKALLNQNRNDYGTINKYILDAKNSGIKVLPPSINKSDRTFSVVDGDVLFGLEGIKGVGEKIVDQIIGEREANGRYKSLTDFIERVNPSTSVMVALIKSGAIPCRSKHEIMERYAKTLIPDKTFTPVVTMPTRKILTEKFGIDCEKYKDKQERLAEYNKVKKQEFYATQVAKKNKFLSEFREKYMQDEQFWEFETLSIFIENNPFTDAYKHINRTINEVEDGEIFVAIGIISNIQKKKDHNGNQYCFYNLYSTFGIIEGVCWASQYKKYEELLKRGTQVAALMRKGDIYNTHFMKPYKQWLADRRLRL